MRSILQKEKQCYFCGSPYVQEHHIYEGRNRQASEKHGFKVYLCAYHHTMSNESVHLNHVINLQLKRICQREFEKTHTREEFLKIIDKNYMEK